MIWNFNDACGEVDTAAAGWRGQTEYLHYLIAAMKTYQHQTTVRMKRQKNLIKTMNYSV